MEFYDTGKYPRLDYELYIDRLKKSNRKAKELLKECLYAFNDMPNTELTNGTTTYELASKIDKLLK